FRSMWAAVLERRADPGGPITGHLGSRLANRRFSTPPATRELQSLPREQTHAVRLSRSAALSSASLSIGLTTRIASAGAARLGQRAVRAVQTRSASIARD